MNEKNFRRMILLYAALVVAAGVAAFEPLGISVSLSEAYENEPAPLIFVNFYFGLAVTLLLVLAGLFGCIGLYQFKTWGRSLSIGATVGGLVVILFLGPSLYSAFENALSEASSFLWGAILAASYWSPVASRFSANKPLQSTREDARA